MMTLSPSSTWGVKVGLCLPRGGGATMEARRPTTSPLASISTHFFSMSAAFAEYVLMISIRGESRFNAGEWTGVLHAGSASVNELSRNKAKQQQGQRK